MLSLFPFGARPAAVSDTVNLSLILRGTTPDTLPVQPGATVAILGSTVGRTINLPTDAAARGLDAGTTVNIQGNAADFALARNGTTVEVLDGGNRVVAQLAAGSEPGALRFADGGVAMTAADGGIVVGGTPLSADTALEGDSLDLDPALATGDAFADSSSLPATPAATNLQIILQNGAPEPLEIAPGFHAEVLGDTGERTVNLREGAAASGLDAGTTVNIEGESGAFTLARNGTTLEVRDAQGTVVAQLAAGAEAGALRFDDGGAAVTVTDQAITVGGRAVPADDEIAAGSVDLDAALSSAPAFGGATKTDNAAPEVTSLLDSQSVALDSFFEIPVDTSAFTDPEGDTLSFSVSGKDGGDLPAWLGFDAESTTLFGTSPADSFDPVEVTVTATDAAGNTVGTGLVVTPDGSNTAAGSNNTSAEEAAARDGVSADDTDAEFGLLGPLDFNAAPSAEDTAGDGAGLAPALTQSSSIANLDAFRADSRFSGIDGSGQTVVVIDSGIDLDHPHFGPDANNDGVSDRILAARDFGGDGVDPTALFNAGITSFVHGTHVTGTALSSDPRFTGVAPGADIIHLQVFEERGGDISARGQSIQRALQWVADNEDRFNVSAVNMSLGAPQSFEQGEQVTALSDEFELLNAQGVTVSVAAGNSFDTRRPIEGIGFPAQDASALSVGASFDTRDAFAPFSQRGDNLDVLAPGVDITAASIGGGVTTLSGTSMAAPHVSGLTALAQDLALDTLGRELPVDEMESLIESTGTPVTDPITGVTTPRIDALALGEAILDLGGGQSDGDEQPTRDDFAGDRTTEGRLSLDAPVAGAIQFAGDSDWLRVELQAGVRYLFELRGADSGGGTLADPWMGLVDASGELIRGNDDGGTGRDARFTLTPRESGTFFVRAEDFGLDDTGSFTLSLSRDGLADDFAGDTSTEGRIAVGGSATGTLEVAGDSDWFAATLSAGTRYRVSLNGTETADDTLDDPWLGLFDAEGNFIDGNDDGGPGLNSALEFTAGRSGSFFFAAEAFAGRDTGSFTLELDRLGASDDFAGDPTTQGRIDVGESVTGTIETARDQDWFRFDFAPGQVLGIDLEGQATGAGDLRDPVLSIRDPGGNVLLFNDDGGTGLNSRLEIETTGTGTVFLSARAFSPSDTGSFTLSVEDLRADDFAADPTTTGTVSATAPTRGAIEQVGDVDWLRLSVEAGVTYQVDLEGRATGGGTLSDPLLDGIFDATGQRIAGTFNDDGGVGLNARTSFTAQSDGEVFVAASAFGRATGRYSVEVTAEGLSGAASADLDAAAPTEQVGLVGVANDPAGQSVAAFNALDDIGRIDVG